jgi:TP901 family phage tail tape measure protein
MPDVAELRVKISLDGADKVASGLKQADSGVSSFASNAGKMGGALGSVATQFAAFGVVAGGAVVAGLGAAIAKASDFEAGMSRVKAAASASSSEMAALGAAAIQLGADTDLAGIGAKDAATAMEELAKGGVSVSDQLGGATKGALLLASAGTISVSDAAGLATKAMNIFSLAGTDVAHVADLMSAGANKSATDVGQLGAAFNQSAAVAKNAGLNIETLTGTLAFFTQRGLEGSDAGTSLKTALLALQAPTDVAAATMKDLGINVRDADGHMLPMADIADVLKDRLSGLSDAQRDAALKTIFGNDAIRVGIGLYEGGGSAIRDWTAKVNDAGNAARTGATINDNLKGSMSQLGAVLETGAIQFGGKLTPVIRTATDEVAKFVQGVMDSPRAQAAFDSFATSASTALTAFFAKVKDPAFQDSAKQWATAALDVGRAVVDLGGKIGSTLGPPLREAVTWFNGLDQAGKQQVIGFGLIAASVVKFRDELGTMKGVVEDVIGAFARKEAAKVSLTAANKLLANSAGGTSTAMKVVGAAALDAGLVIGSTALVTYGALKAVAEYGKANGDSAQQAQYATTQEQLRAVALANSGSEYLNVIGPFLSFVNAQDRSTAATRDAATQWNLYLAMLQATGQPLDSLNAAAMGTAGAMQALSPALQAAGYELGNAGNRGAGFNNTLVGIGVGAQAMVGVFSGAAAGVAEMNNRLGEGAIAGAGFNNTLVGVGVGASALVSTVTAVASQQQQANKAVQDAQVAWLQAQNAQENYGGALATFGEQARHAQDNFNGLVQQQQAAGQQASVYSGQLGLLEGGMDRLNARYQQGIPLSAAQVASYQQAAQAAAFYRVGIGSLTESQFTNAIAAQQQITAAEAMVRNSALLTGASTTVADSLKGQAGAYLTLVANVEATNSALRVATQEHSTLGGELNTFTSRVAALTQQEKDYAAGKAGVAKLTADESNQLNQLNGIIPGMTEAYRLQAVQVTNMEIAHVRANAALQEAQQAFQGQNTAMVSSGTALADAALKAGTLTQAQHDLAVASIASASNAFDLTAAINSIPGQHVTQFVVDAAGAIELVSQFGTHLFDVPKEYATKLQNNSTDLIPLIDQYGQAFLHVPADWVTNVNNNAGEQTPVVDGYGRIVAQIPQEWATTFLHNAGEVIPVVDNYGNVIKTVERSKVTEFLANTTGAIATTNDYNQQIINIPPTATTTVSAPGAATAATDIGAVATAATTVPPTATTTVSAPGALGASAAIGAVAAAAGLVPQVASTNVSAPGALGSAISIGAVTAAALAVPQSATTTTVAINTAQAAGQIAGVTAAVNLVPKSFTVTAVVDTGPALAAIADLAAHMPHSPAEKGPFRVLPNWQAVFDSFGPAVTGALGQVAKLGGGISDAVAAGAKRAADIVGSLATTIKSGMEALSGLAAFNPATMAPTDAQRGGFLAALTPLLADLRAATTTYSKESADAATRWADTSGKLLGVVKTGLDALSGLVTFVAPARANIAAFKFATEALVTDLGDSAALMDADFVAGAAMWAEEAGKALGILKSGADGLRALIGFVAPGQAQIGQFKFATESLVQSLGDSAVAMDATFAANAGVWATGAGKALGIIKSGVDAFAALGTLVVPTQASIGAFKFATEFLVQSLGDSAAVMDKEFAAHAAAWGEGAGKALALLKAGTAGLADLITFVAPTPAQIGAFKFAAESLVLSLGESAAAMDSRFVAAAAAWSDGAGKALGVLKSGLDAFKGLAIYADPPRAAVAAFGATLLAVVAEFAAIADRSTRAGTDAAAAFATGAGAIVATLGTGVAAFAKLADYKGTPLAAIAAFGDALRAAVDGFALLSAQITPQAVAAAAIFAEGAGKVIAILASGVTGFTALATFAAPASSAIAAFGTTLRAVIADLARVAIEVTQQATDSAARFAGGATTVLGVFGNGIAGLMDLAKFVAPSQTAIDNFAYAVGHLVERFANAAQMIGADGVTAAGQFGTAAKLAVDTIKIGLDAFKAFKDMVIPSAGAIDELVAGVSYVVRRFAEMADEMGKGALGKAQDFATAVGASAKAVQTAIGTFKSLTEAPFKGALTAIMTEFRGDFDRALTLMKEAAASAADYETSARMYKEAMLNAATSIAAGNAAAATAAVPGSGLGANMAEAGAHLGNSLAGGMRDSLEIHSPSRVAAGIGGEVMAGLVQGLGGGEPAAVKAAAEAASAIAGAISATFDAFAKAAAFDGSGVSGVKRLGGALRGIIADWTWLARQYSVEGIKAAATFAEGTGKIVATIGAAATALTGLAAYADPPRAAWGRLGAALQGVLADMIWLAGRFPAEGIAAAVAFADGAGKIVGFLGAGVTGLSALRDFVAPTEGAITAFADGAAALIGRIVAVAARFTASGIAAAGQFAEGAGKVLGLLGAGVAGLTGLRDFVQPAWSAIDAFADTTANLVYRIGAYGARLNGEGVAAAATFAEGAGKILGALGSGAATLASLRDFMAPAWSAIDAFADTATNLVYRIIEYGSRLDGDGVKAAAVFAEGAGKVLGALGSGAATLTSLRDFMQPAWSAIDAFADSTTNLVYRIGEYGGRLSTEGVQAAATFAEGAGKVLGSLGSGAATLASLRDFLAPSAGAIDAFADASAYLTQRFGIAARSVGVDLATEAGAFASGVGATLQVLSGATGLAALGTFLAPSATAIDDFVGSAAYLTQRFGAAARAIGVDLAGAAGAFATGVGATLQALSGASGLAALGTFLAPSVFAIDDFVGSATYLAQRFGVAVRAVGVDLATEAGAFATGIGAVLSALSGAANLSALGTFLAPSVFAVNDFVGISTYLVRTLVIAARSMDAEGVAAAGVWADGAGKILGIVANGATGLAALGQFVAPSGAAIDAFAGSVGQLVARIDGIARYFDASGVAAAGQFADSAGKVLGIVGGGVQGLAGLLSFVAPGTAAMDAFALAVRDMVARFGQMAATLETQGLDAATALAAAVGAIFDGLGKASAYFKSLDGILLPDAAGIDRLLAPIARTIAAVSALSGSLGAGGLGAAGDAGDALGRLFAGLKAGNDYLSAGPVPVAAGAGGYGGGASGGGGGITVAIYGNVYGQDDLQNLVVSAVVEAQRRGRL